MTRPGTNPTSDRDASPPCAWLEVVSTEPVSHACGVTEALRRVGVDVVARSTCALGSGVLFFDRLNPDVLAALRELARGGLQRVLAVAVDAAVLAGGGARALLEAGASDVLAWGSSDEPARAVATRLARWDAVERLVRAPIVRDSLVGESATWISFLRQVVEVAAFSDASVLVVGESGTGKELVARIIHMLDARPEKRDLVVLDSTTIVPELSGSEFFGHERGAFTGAVGLREGAFALANGGTLFLDEVGELPLALQARLLRVVQERTYKRVGGNGWCRTEFRLVCATNRDLADEVRRDAFRGDFYYRIASCVCRTPPLRDRREDILPLARHLLRQLRPGAAPLELDGAVVDYLLTRDYPGNVRDLQRVVAQMGRRHAGPGPITVGDVPPDLRPRLGEPGQWQDDDFDHAIGRAVAMGVGLRDISRAATAAAVRVAMLAETGNLKRAAKRLGVTDRALQMRRAQGSVM